MVLRPHRWHSQPSRWNTKNGSTASNGRLSFLARRACLVIRPWLRRAHLVPQNSRERPVWPDTRLISPWHSRHFRSATTAVRRASLQEPQSCEADRNAAPQSTQVRRFDRTVSKRVRAAISGSPDRAKPEQSWEQCRCIPLDGLSPVGLKATPQLSQIRLGGWTKAIRQIVEQNCRSRDFREENTSPHSLQGWTTRCLDIGTM